MNQTTEAGTESEVGAVETALTRLCNSLARNQSRARCLRRWSEFVRERDGQRCVDCHSCDGLSAHHICRKSFVEQAQFDTGNGITLCRDCHREAHRFFNGRPDPGLPADAQGGEKLALMERFYSILLDDALERGMLREEFYFLSDAVLGSFKKMQGYATTTEFPGSRLEQAYLILAEPECPLRNAITEANGFALGDEPLLPGGAVVVLGSGRQPGDRTIIRRYRPRSI